MRGWPPPRSGLSGAQADEDRRWDASIGASPAGGRAPCRASGGGHLARRHVPVLCPRIIDRGRRRGGKSHERQTERAEEIVS